MLVRTAVIALLASAATLVKGQHHYGSVTYYTPGLGACGAYSKPSDYIVAVGANTFDSYPGAGPNPNKNPICFKQIRVSSPDQGRTVQATVGDRCAGCPGAADLDLSPAAFNQLASPSAGRLNNVQWDFV